MGFQHWNHIWEAKTGDDVVTAVKRHVKEQNTHFRPSLHAEYACLQRRCKIRNKSHEATYYGLQTNDWLPLTLQLLQNFVNWPRFFTHNQSARSATRVSALSPWRRPQNVLNHHSTHFYVMWPAIKLHSYGVRCTNNSQLRITGSSNATGPTAHETLSVYPTNVHTKQGPWWSTCQEQGVDKSPEVSQIKIWEEGKGAPMVWDLERNTVLRQ
jgi:hypothetical protein